MGMGLLERLGCSLTLLFLTACAAPPPKPVPTVLVIQSSADLNPDNQGRASPVVVRVYQLRTDAEFNAATFFTLYDNEKAALGASLISRDEFSLKPAEKQQIELPVSSEARFFGVLAGYRDPAAQWRSLAPESGKRPKAASVVHRLRVRLDKTAVVLTIND